MKALTTIKPKNINDKCFVSMATDEQSGFLKVTATIYDAVGSINDYTNLLFALNAAKPNDTIIINICSPGGSVSTGLRIMQAINNCKGRVVTKSVGPCQSIAACIWAVGHERLMTEPFGSLMVHMPSADISGKTSDIANDCKFTNEFFADLLKKIFVGIVKEDELSDIIDKSIDKYFSASVVNERLNQHQEVK